MSDETSEPTLEELQAELEKAVAKNVYLEEELRKLGVSPNHFVLLSLRLNLLMNFLFDDRGRFEYEIESSKEVQHLLLQIQQQVLEERANPKLLIPQPSTQLPPGFKL